ncbi:hypothetical protein JRO89_XS09G0002900 [Xanthoceras sorbifolium]|uniref:Large ribosomal subunit protein uL30-like ferredoxin-like fold domain-containing protein n=1 Tax=Xanthoceras sorbifolium TaxID=99658 RepID=A0ABQ8HK05_9ROSI|nr:hypothetical protein JRO89_XS09G0002900 [Xanthoceras sorbifolium]
MAEEETKPLGYIAETVLKKRRSTESLALARKAQLELGNFNQNKRKKKEVHDIKRPEQFVKQFRDQFSEHPTWDLKDVWLRWTELMNENQFSAFWKLMGLIRKSCLVMFLLISVQIEQLQSSNSAEIDVDEIMFSLIELDLIRMKQRAKRPKSAIMKPKSMLLFVVRIQGKNDMHPKTRKILYNLRLRRIFSGVFVKASEGIIQMLQRVEPYVTYGYPNLKNVKDLIYKKGYANTQKQRVPLTDNNIIEQELGKYGIICIEDIVHEIANVGPHFKEVISFLGPLQLNKPEGGLLGKKQPFKDGGEAGNREDQINELIEKMN